MGSYVCKRESGSRKGRTHDYGESHDREKSYATTVGSTIMESRDIRLIIMKVMIVKKSYARGI